MPMAAAELRCSRPRETVRQDRDAHRDASRGAAELRCSRRLGQVAARPSESPLRLRPDRETEAALSPLDRRHVACMHLRSSVASSLVAPVQRAQATRRLPPAVHGRLRLAARSDRTRSASCLAIACAGCARADVCPAGAQRARWSCTPCTPAAPLIARSPHPRIARHVCAPHHRCRARSRGYRPVVDITRDYAQASCLCRRGMRHPCRTQARARVIRRYVNGRPAHPCACEGAALPARMVCASCTRCARLHAIPGLLPRCSVSRLRVGCCLRLRPGHGHAPEGQEPSPG